MTREQLKQLQGLPLDIKIKKSKIRISEWYEYFNSAVYVSFSGGKDSTVLLHLARQLYPDIDAVFCDTGLEYPEIKQFVKSQKNVTIIKPKICFKDVISKHGYPVISKETSEKIYKMKNYNLSDRLRNYFLNGDERGKMGMIPKKWQFLIDEDVKIGSQCCDIMKKRPFKEYEKISGNKPITGTMAHESKLRKTTYLKQGCNSFDSKRQVSNPLGFWTEHDILEYIHRYNICICDVYGNLYKEKGTYKLSGVQRTGCVFCLFGIHLEKYPNRLQKLQLSHPELYNYCIKNLELNKVLDLIKVPYTRPKLDKNKYKIDTIKISCRVDKNKFDFIKSLYADLTTTETIDLLIDSKLKSVRHFKRFDKFKGD